MEDIIVRAVDVGYGNVKYTLAHQSAHSTIECGIFPSRSPIATDKDLAAGLLRRRDTVVVDVNGTSYEVGNDVSLAQGAYDESAVLDPDFSLTDAYLARMCGALYYMQDTDPETNRSYMEGNKIGLLAVGLPVSTYRRHKERLEKLLVGHHPLPSDRSVTVERARVLPQPLGAFFEYAFRNGALEEMNSQNTLIIDPGFFTFDYLLVHGMVPIDSRSDAVYRGMSAVLRAMAEEINNREGLNTQISALIRILDDAHRTGRPAKVFGKELNLDDYLPRGKVVINEAVTAMVNKVGDGVDIQNIIVAGGGAKFYLEAIQEKFPRHNIIVTDEPVNANVRGFHLAGEHWAHGIRVKQEKARRQMEGVR